MNYLDKQLELSKRLVAHRGYSLRYPENSLIAIQAALDAHTLYVEFDVQLSIDKVPVLYHDRDMQRLSQQPGAIHDYTLAELTNFYTVDKKKFPGKYNNNPISQLSEIIDLIKNYPQLTVFVELKRISINKFGSKIMLESVLPCLEPIQNQCVMISYSLDVLRQLRKQTRYPVGVVNDSWHQRQQPEILDLKPEYFFCDIASLPAGGDLTFGNTDCDTQIAVYECVVPEQAANVMQRGISLVETFAIAEMQAALQGK